MFNTVVLATDGSTNGDRAVELVKVFAQQARSKVVVVHVTELVGGRDGTYPVAADEEEILAKITAQVADLNAVGVAARLTTHVVSLGGLAHVITESAESVGADLIVVGSRGHSPLAHVVLGSVPRRSARGFRWSALRRGLEPGTGLRMSQVAEDLLPGHPAAVLTGPNLAREIMAGNAAAAVIATHDRVARPSPADRGLQLVPARISRSLRLPRRILAAAYPG